MLYSLMPSPRTFSTSKVASGSDETRSGSIRSVAPDSPPPLVNPRLRLHSTTSDSDACHGRCGRHGARADCGRQARSRHRPVSRFVPGADDVVEGCHQLLTRPAASSGRPRDVMGGMLWANGQTPDRTTIAYDGAGTGRPTRDPDEQEPHQTRPRTSTRDQAGTSSHNSKSSSRSARYPLCRGSNSMAPDPTKSPRRPPCDRLRVGVRADQVEVEPT